jgi:hypothetical protein
VADRGRGMKHAIKHIHFVVSGAMPTKVRWPIEAGA